MAKDGSLFSSPFFLGFDHLERMFESVVKASDSYPPYNIEVIGENGFIISLAVAGFDSDNLSVEIEDNKLTIKGKQANDENKVFIHRGIATRQFQKYFILAEGVTVVSADLNNGLLNINLMKPKSSSRAKKIEINDLSNKKPNKSLTYDIDIK